MNTLSKTQTAAFFPSTADYLAFRRHWSSLLRSERRHNLKAEHHLLYLVLTGRDWRKAFTYPTDLHKLANGYTPALYTALEWLAWPGGAKYMLAPFDDLVSQDALAAVREVLAHVLRARPPAGSDGRPDCPAYTARQEG